MELACVVQDALGPDLQSAVEHAADAYLEGDTMAPVCAGDSLCSTHWLPLHEGLHTRPPANALEAHAARLVQLPDVQRRLGAETASLAGVEWWLQEQDPDDEPKGLHTDKDVTFGAEEESSCIERCPFVSSVLYLSDTGGPTAVFDQRKRDSTLWPRVPTAVTLGFPRRGQLLLFDGALLHGVLHPPPGVARALSSEQPRRTLLVNLWRDEPAAAREPAAQQPVELPPPPPTTAAPAVAGCNSGASSLEPLSLELPHAFLDDAPSWRAQHLPPPLSEALATLSKASPGTAGAATSPPFVHVRYAQRAGNRAIEEAQEPTPSQSPRPSWDVRIEQEWYDRPDEP